MDYNTREIESITFGIYSPEEVLNMSVCKIDNPKKDNSAGTVYDPRMGTTDSSQICETCKGNATECPGHFGHIELNEPIVHPLFYKRVNSFLNCFCLKCCRLILQKDQIFISGLNRYKGEARFNRILEKLQKVDICCQPTDELDEDGEPILCGKDKPKIKFSNTDNSYSIIYMDSKKNKTSIILTTEEIKKLFDSVTNEDVTTLGFDPELTHPRNFIISILPVLPPCDRPYVKADNKMCDDDLTNQYCEIIKANNILADKDDEETNANGKKNKRKLEQRETTRQRALASLRFRILTTFNNSQGKAKHTTNGRPIKSIKERLTGKDGQIRNNMMGKRSILPDTPVLMWSGKIKTAENIKVGDVVIGDDGLPRTVINTVTGTSPLYKVKQSYGDDYGISCEHILTLKFCGHCEIQWRENQGKKGCWFMAWYDRKTKTCKSKKIGVLKSRPKEQAYDMMVKLRDTINQNPIIDIHVKDYLNLPITKRRLMFGVKLNTPIKWNYQEVCFDPRMLGMWLGDGGKDTIVFTNQDSELIEYCRKWAEKQGGALTTYNDGLHHGISSCQFTQVLKDCGIYNNKHIPKEYLFNSEQVRLQVLAGLIDTYGSVEKDGRTIRITQSEYHKKIIIDTQFLAQSLGFRATLRSKKTSWKYNKIIKTRKVLVLTISGYGIEQIPTLLHRKRCSTPKGTDMTCYSIEVIENGIGRFCGFEVDQNNRFLLGDFTITHNCDQTGRTVIGPDPTLRMGELGVPEEMVKILTVPVRVTGFNLNILQTLVNEGNVNSLIKPDGETVIDLKRFRLGTRLMHGDIIHRSGEKITVIDGRELVIEGDRVERNGEFLENLKFANRNYNLNIGWIVNRPLQDGDYILLNRQPTLHKASMMAMKVKIKPYKTLRMNLAITKPFNADFDGDEMNIHVPQSLEAQTELKYLSAAQYNMISPQSSKPNMAIVQDSLLGAYRMTQGIKKLTKGQFFNIAMKLPRAPWSKHKSESVDDLMSTEEIMDRIQHIRRILKEKGKKVQCYNGHGLISLFLPEDFIYEKMNEKHSDEPSVKIWRGVMYEGTLDKSIIGSAHNSIHQLIHKEYGAESASHFIDCIQFTTNNYLLVDGFTVGLGDCLIPQTTNKYGVTKEEEIRDVVRKCYVEAEGIKETTTHPVIREIRINASLNKAKDIGLRIAKESLTDDNSFLSTVHSGSKGDFFNIAQITGLLGQQNLKGARVPLFLNHGKRSLPHYPFGNLDPEMEYESRGFIDRGFLRGLNPRQFFFHAMSGREGICDKLIVVSQTAGCLLVEGKQCYLLVLLIIW